MELTIGCLLQILNPNPDAMSKMITENASEEFLYSLSNYCALQVIKKKDNLVLVDIVRSHLMKRLDLKCSITYLFSAYECD